MVEFEDGSVIAQISATDMRMPIQYALTWPDRASAPVPKIDWSQTRAWDFHAPDLDRFPLLRLAYDTLRAGGAASCILNAADEIAVEAFLAEKIGFTGIARVVRETLEKMPHAEPQSIAEVLSVDLEARRVARDIVAENAILVGAKG
jgi:1-deoxy-D-xylulose-5-phosphate reductoisomerase